MPIIYQKKAIVLGAGGFIGGHLVKRLKKEGYWVRGVDIKHNEYHNYADEFIVGDLTDPNVVQLAIPEKIDEVYQLAADMGGALYIFTGQNDANVMHNSALINLNVVHECVKKKVKKVFYSSSACTYPEYNQMDPNNPKCSEKDAYPAEPDSEYGWEKIFSERLYLAYNRNYKLDVRIARFHNIFGPYGTYKGGKEKAPAAICRKAIETPAGGELEVWGDGLQTRSFLYIDECIEAVIRFMRQDSFIGPVNIGSEEMVTINQLAEIAIKLSGKNITIKNLEGEEFKQKYGFKCPTGVRGRNSDNTLYRQKIGWEPSQPLKVGVEKTFNWISKIFNNNRMENSGIKNVLIGIPVKNCGAWLETVVHQIININYHKENISIVFIENDSVDYSHDVVEYCIEKLLKKYNYRSISYEQMPLGFHLPHESRHDFRHMTGRMNSLKIIRNHIVDTYLKDNDYLWWVDADYKYIPPNFLIDAINFDKDIIMPRVEVDGINYDGMTHADIDGLGVPIDEVAKKFDCDFYPMNLVECAALISRKVFDYGLRYDSGILKGNDGTEHFYQEGTHFSHRAKLSGFTLYGSLKHIIIHQSINGMIPFEG